MKLLLKKYKKTFVYLFSSFLFLFFGFLLVLFFYKNEYPKLEILSGYGAPGLRWDKHAPGGQYEFVEFVKGEKFDPLRGPRNAQIVNKAYYKDKSIIYDITYDYDQFGRRFEPHSSLPLENQNKKFAAFFGCSDLLGVGVKGSETIPYLFEKLQNDFISYNYGFVGTGPHYVLRLLETQNFKNEIPENEGYFFYVVTEGHYPKTLARAFTLVRPVMPVYEFNTDKVNASETLKAEYQGTLEELHPISAWTKKWLAGSHLGVLAGGTFITEGMRYKKAERDLICQILVQSREKAVEIKPNAKFVIVLHTLLPWDDRGRIIDCAKDKNLDYINIELPYTDEFVTDNVYFHPSKKVNEIVAKEIQKYLVTKSGQAYVR